MSKTTIYCPKCGEAYDWTISHDRNERAYFAECPDCAGFAACPDYSEPEPSLWCSDEPPFLDGELHNPLDVPVGIVTGLGLALAVWVVVIVVFCLWPW